MLRSLSFEIYFVLASLAAALCLLWLGFDPTLVALVTLLPYLGRNLYRLGHLSLLLHRQHRMAPPFPKGLWGDIYRSVARYQQRGRKHRKRQLRFLRRFREVAVSVPDALIILDKRQRIEWANPAAAELMNVQWPRDEARKLTEIFHHEQLDELIANGTYSRPAELAPPHNRAIMLSVSIAAFGERKQQRLVVGRDITEVFHINLIRRDFVANASHELRTPLTVIAGFLENLVDSELTPRSHRRPMQLMCKQAERMRSIIDDLLSLSRLEMEDRSPQIECVDVPDELRRILGEVRLLDRGEHELIADIAPDLLLHGKAAELCSAFSNLVLNAISHTSKGSRIWIDWRICEGEPLFAVRDNGEGMAPEHVPRLTERFYRIDKARSRASGGTGLGLAIVKHVLSRHDARLTVESEMRQGSTFTCHFPASAALNRSEISPRASDLAESH
jgi:two-component system phosphate regulon sensor histidine kinase PhoR